MIIVALSPTALCPLFYLHSVFVYVQLLAVHTHVMGQPRQWATVADPLLTVAAVTVAHYCICVYYSTPRVRDLGGCNI
jgi:hypothetical protein